MPSDFKDNKAENTIIQSERLKKLSLMNDPPGLADFIGEMNHLDNMFADAGVLCDKPEKLADDVQSQHDNWTCKRNKLRFRRLLDTDIGQGRYRVKSSKGLVTVHIGID